jgi:glycosyltransferase involved in cell wall biosynthesis
MKISLIQPSRNNLKYLKWSYDSIRKNQGDHEVEICVADDFSDKDDTWRWCQEMMEKDPLFKSIRNEGPTRLGHTILYDTLVNKVATNDICMIYHADMYLCPGALDTVENHMMPYQPDYPASGLPVERIKNLKTIVSLTRIEPPLHPDGPEKVLQDFGIEPEEFKEDELLEFISNARMAKETTEGIFAPWAFWKSDFQEIGGHDAIFAPQSKEDTDIFNRFHLNGIKFIQTWEGFVYHMTCRGSRFAEGATRNPNGEVFMKNRETDEWLAQNQKSTREFLRKWGHFCKHDALMKPIVPPKYDIGFIVKNCNVQLLETLEPWCSMVYVDESSDSAMCDNYIILESPNTSFDLYERIRPFDNEKNNEILVTIDGSNISQQDFQIIQQLSEIIQDSGEIGRFELGNLVIEVIQLNTYENNLIINEG